MHLKIIFLILVSVFLTNASQCISKSPVCVDFQTIQNCANASRGYEPVGDPVPCPDGQICVQSTDSAKCQHLDIEAFISNSLDSDTPQPVPQCSGSGKYATNVCNKYYECVQFMIFWWTPELKTCPDGEFFDSSTSTCLPSDQVNCGSKTTTTTPPTPIVVPECKGATKHKALLCYQYFECVQKLWWFEPQLKTCPNGQGFDASKGQCVCAGTVGCALAQSQPKCNGPGSLPSTSCTQYYQCSQKLWWWETTLTDCPSGQNYDTSTCQCADAGTVTCTLLEPTCYGWARYPAPQKNQYYECTLDGSGLDWTAVLKTCYVGFVFDVRVGDCVRG